MTLAHALQNGVAIRFTQLAASSPSAQFKLRITHYVGFIPASEVNAERYNMLVRFRDASAVRLCPLEAVIAPGAILNRDTVLYLLLIVGFQDIKPIYIAAFARRLNKTNEEVMAIWGAWSQYPRPWISQVFLDLASVLRLPSPDTDTPPMVLHQQFMFPDAVRAHPPAEAFTYTTLYQHFPGDNSATVFMNGLGTRVL